MPSVQQQILQPGGLFQMGEEGKRQAVGSACCTALVPALLSLSLFQCGGRLSLQEQGENILQALGMSLVKISGNRFSAL